MRQQTTCQRYKTDLRCCCCCYSREFYWTDFGNVVGGVYFLFFSPFLLSVSSPSSRSPFWFFQSNHRRRRRRRHGRTPLLFVWGLRLFSLCAVHFQPRSSQPPPPDLCHLWPRSFVPSSKCASDGGDRRCRLLAALAVLAVLVVVCLLLWMDAHSLVPLFFLSSSSLVLPSTLHPPTTVPRRVQSIGVAFLQRRHSMGQRLPSQCRCGQPPQKKHHRHHQ